MDKISQPKRVLSAANRMIFTDKNVASLKAKRKQYLVWDGGNGTSRGSGEVCRGLHILVSPTGAKSYRSAFYFPGSSKMRSRHLGRVGEQTLEDARKQCAQDRTKARDGIDPRSADSRKSDSYESCVEDYITRVQINDRHAPTAHEIKRTLLRHVPDWSERPIATILPMEIQKRLEEIRDGDKDKGTKPRPYAANKFWATAKPFFAWCAKPTIAKLKVSPMVGIDQPWNGAKGRERSWFSGDAADEAIKSLWNVANQLEASKQQHEKVEGKYLKMMLLLGKRKSALANMQWSDIDAKWFWKPPAPASTKKRLHGVPLPALAQRVLGSRKSGFVFPGSDRGHVRVKNTKVTDKIIDMGGPSDFFWHGCRHLMESKLAELKVLPHVADLLLDHAPNRGSGKNYNHYLYHDEMLAALELWADHVEGLVTPAGVRLAR